MDGYTFRAISWVRKDKSAMFGKERRWIHPSRGQALALAQRKFLEAPPPPRSLWLNWIWNPAKDLANSKSQMLFAASRRDRPVTTTQPKSRLVTNTISSDLSAVGHTGECIRL